MSAQKVLLGIVISAVFVRLIVFFVALDARGVEGLVKADALGYLELAANLISRSEFAIKSGDVYQPEVFRTPGLPILIAPFTALPYGIILYSVVLSIIAGILMPLMLYAIAERITSKRAAFIAAGLIALEPHAINFSFFLLTEVPFMLFMLGGTLAGFVSFERKSYIFAALSGALLGYAVLIRPGFLSIFLLALIGVALAVFFMRDIRFRYILVSIGVLMLVLTPWLMRNERITGSISLSGAGWRNVYTDFLASVRALENNTTFHDEKNKLKDEALEKYGLSRTEMNSPAHSTILRDAAIVELWQYKATVFRLESTLLTSFFINDGYYYEFRNLGLVTDIPGTHISPTYEILTKGVRGIPAVWDELVRQRFIPLFGRLFVVSVLVCAVIGFFIIRHPIKYMLAFVVALTALFATVIGLGLDARMRVPIEPILFVFASAAFIWIFDKLKTKYAT
jgi:4-amino-4-deoxy-L-arabinose transferase-like glycosyltransferase